MTRRPVRVLHLLPQLRLGGMEQGVVKLVNGLRPEHVTSAVCAFDGRTDAIAQSLDPRVPVHVLGRRTGNDPGLVWRLARLIRRDNPDIVHSHSWGTLCEGYVATRLAGAARFVHSEHGTMDLRPRNVVVQRWVWSRADRVLSVSSRLADRMAREARFPRARVQVIRNGADLSRFGMVEPGAARRALGLPPDVFVVGTVGRLVPVKDHETLFSALVHLKGAGVDAAAVIVGDGPLRADLEARARALSLDTVVRFAGDRRDVPAILPAFDVFVLTSASEGLPNAVLEAMASGLPVVSTGVGGVDELVEDGRTGMIAPAGDSRTIAAAIGMLFHDPGLRLRMGVASRTKARSEFALERMLGEYERCYLELAGRLAVPDRPLGESQSSCAESLAG